MLVCAGTSRTPRWQAVMEILRNRAVHETDFGYCFGLAVQRLGLL
jgi:hypothetical protein